MFNILSPGSAARTVAVEKYSLLAYRFPVAYLH